MYIPSLEIEVFYLESLAVHLVFSNYTFVIITTIYQPGNKFRLYFTEMNSRFDFIEGSIKKKIV